MKINFKNVFFLALALPAALPCPAGAEFLIVLKDGGKIVTGQYWFHQNEIRFYYAGGTAGIEKDAIERITPAEIRRREEEQSKVSPLTTPAAIKKAPGQGASPLPGSVKSLPAITNQDDPLLKKFQHLFLRSKEIAVLTTGELHELSSDIMALKKEVLSKGLGHLYTEQLMELYKAGDSVEGVLSSKPQ